MQVNPLQFYDLQLVVIPKSTAQQPHRSQQNFWSLLMAQAMVHLAGLRMFGVWK